MLSPLGGEFFLRANIWPSPDEHMFRASGGGAFVYGLPHDHNFDFLTLGYFGPGYWSDYWEYDYEAVAGAVGEPAGLRFVERSRLEPGKLMHYRAHRDVHSQLPPDALSVSLNVMHAGGAQGWLDQYRFDVERNTIAGVLSPGASEVFLRIAVGLGGEEARDLAERFARTHPSDRMRLTALEAQAGVLDAAARRAVAAGGGSGAGWSRWKRRRRRCWLGNSERGRVRASRGKVVGSTFVIRRRAAPRASPPASRSIAACRITAAAWLSIRSARLARLMSWSIIAALGARGRPALVPQQHRQAERRRGCGHRRGSPARAGRRCRPC